MLKYIKDISSDSVKLVTEFGSPGMIRSLHKIKEIASIVQEIIDFLEEPKMTNNIEGMRAAFEAVQHARDRFRTVSTQINETGIVNETKNMAVCIKNKSDSSSDQNLKLAIAFNDVAKSFKSLSNELRRPWADR